MLSGYAVYRNKGYKAECGAGTAGTGVMQHIPGLWNNQEFETEEAQEEDLHLSAGRTGAGHSLCHGFECLLWRPAQFKQIF